MQANRDLGERGKAALIVAALHALLGYALMTGFSETIVRRLGAEIRVFEVREPPPPPPPARPPPEIPGVAPTPISAGGSPPPNAAPSVVTAAASPVVAAPAPTPDLPPLGPATSTGDGGGSGTGGLGSGGEDGGTGGGAARRAERVAGALRDSDYPRQALRMGIEGTVKVRFTVAADGRATDCAIVETSGFAELDQTTCRLIERRFRYRPALDALGRAVPQDETRFYDWWLPKRR